MAKIQRRAQRVQDIQGILQRRFERSNLTYVDVGKLIDKTTSSAFRYLNGAPMWLSDAIKLARALGYELRLEVKSDLGGE